MCGLTRDQARAGHQCIQDPENGCQGGCRQAPWTQLSRAARHPAGATGKTQHSESGARLGTAGATASLCVTGWALVLIERPLPSDRGQWVAPQLRFSTFLC